MNFCLLICLVLLLLTTRNLVWILTYLFSRSFIRFVDRYYNYRAIVKVGESLLRNANEFPKIFGETDPDGGVYGPGVIKEVRHQRVYPYGDTNEVHGEMKGNNNCTKTAQMLPRPIMPDPGTGAI